MDYIELFNSFGFPVALLVLIIWIGQKFVKGLLIWAKDSFKASQNQETQYIGFLQSSMLNMSELLKVNQDILNRNTKVMQRFIEKYELIKN